MRQCEEQQLVRDKFVWDFFLCADWLGQSARAWVSKQHQNSMKIDEQWESWMNPMRDKSWRHVPWIGGEHGRHLRAKLGHKLESKSETQTKNKKQNSKGYGPWTTICATCFWIITFEIRPLERQDDHSSDHQGWANKYCFGSFFSCTPKSSKLQLNKCTKSATYPKTLTISLKFVSIKKGKKIPLRTGERKRLGPFLRISCVSLGRRIGTALSVLDVDG